MSTRALENLARVRQAYVGFSRDDVEMIRSEFAAGGMIQFAGRSPLVPWHAGVEDMDQLPSFLELLRAKLVFEQVQVHTQIAGENDVAVRLRVRYRVRATGRVVDQEQVHWWTIEGGKIAKLTHFEDTAQVAAACSEACV